MAIKPTTPAKPKADKATKADKPAAAPKPAKPKEEAQSFEFAVMSAVRVNGKRREAGEVVELTMDVAQGLLDAGVISTDLPDDEVTEPVKEDDTKE